jgi:rhomboid protease GluP
MSELIESPEPKWVIAENWLTRKPDPNALIAVLLSVLLVVLGSCFYWYNVIESRELLAANGEKIFTQQELWRAWTSLLVHGDTKHLVGNLFLFSVLGYFLAGYFGYLLFPLLGFFFGGVTNLIVLHSMPPLIHLIGLSGVVFWMGGAWLALYFLIETRKTPGQKILRTMGVALGLFMPSEAFDPSVSYAAHGVGFSLGVCAGILFYFINRNRIRSAEVRELEIPI